MEKRGKKLVTLSDNVNSFDKLYWVWRASINAQTLGVFFKGNILVTVNGDFSCLALGTGSFELKMTCEEWKDTRGFGEKHFLP